MQPLESETSFVDDFAGLSDPRSKRNQLYTLEEILLVSLCASVCGAEGWQDVEDFGKLFRKWVYSIAKKSYVKVIAIDGKSLRHSFDEDTKMLHVISAFATEARIVLGSGKGIPKK